MKQLVGAFAIATMLAGSAGAQTLGSELTGHPDPKRAAYYVANADAIRGLTATATDVARPKDSRLKALETLNLKYADAGVSAAIRLVKDKDPEIARAAAQILSASITMSDHAAHQHGELTANQRYAAERHALARDALRGVLESPDAQVRAIAAGSLADLSDQAALAAIRNGVQKNLYTEVEAVNYFGRADPKIGVPLILPYLDTGAPAARSAAVGYLGANNDYQPAVRDRALLNTAAPPEVRASAAKVLGQYDRTFSTYALAVALDPNLPANVYAEVVSGYVTQAQRKGQLSPATIGVLSESLRTRIGVQPHSDLMALQKRIQLLPQ